MCTLHSITQQTHNERCSDVVTTLLRRFVFAGKEEFAPLRNNLFHFRIEPFSEERQNSFNKINADTVKATFTKNILTNTQKDYEKTKKNKH